MTTTHQFTGTATLYSDDTQFEKKVGLEISFRARFDPPVWRVRAADFKPVELADVESGGRKFDLVVTLDEDAKGSYDVTTGALSIFTVFEFNPDLPLVPSSDLKITLDGGSYTLRPGAEVRGSPYDKTTGALSLAGIGTFVSGTLRDTRCAIQLDGVFKPQP